MKKKILYWSCSDVWILKCIVLVEKFIVELCGIVLGCYCNLKMRKESNMH